MSSCKSTWEWDARDQGCLDRIEGRYWSLKFQTMSLAIEPWPILILWEMVKLVKVLVDDKYLLRSRRLTTGRGSIGNNRWVSGRASFLNVPLWEQDHGSWYLYAPNVTPCKCNAS